MERLFKCSYCDIIFRKELDCIKHEGKLHKDGITCPECHGSGTCLGTDGCDERTCPMCKGIGVVVEKKTITYEALK